MCAEFLFLLNWGSGRDMQQGSIAIELRVACRGSFIVLQAMLVVFVSIAEEEEKEAEEEEEEGCSDCW